MNSRRGAVLVESALALPLILAFTYGSIQLGMVGLEQLTVDGGAYAAAHQKALLGANLNGYDDAATVAKAALPHLNASSVTVHDPTLGPPPPTEYTDTYAASNANARHGGVSMIEPVQTVAFVDSKNFLSLILGSASNISVSGIAIDPAFRLINGHGDVSGNSFNTAGAFSTASDPLVDGNNAPPYFVGYNYMRQCPYTTPAAKAPWTTCPSAPKLFVGVGLAEYLDTNNWGRALNGVIPDRTAVFYEARLHQDKYAQIASDLSKINPAQKAAYLDPSLVNGPVACIYSFDNANLGSYAVGTTKIGDFPLNPGGDPVKCGP